MITVNGNKIDWQQEMTITNILKIMNYDYPLISVFVNDELILRDDYDSCKVDDSAEVKVIHICHGG